MSKSNSNKKEVRIRVVGQRRNEPDVRRIAKAIIRMSLDSEDATDRLLDLAADERAIARRRRVDDTPPEDTAA